MCFFGLSASDAVTEVTQLTRDCGAQVGVVLDRQGGRKKGTPNKLTAQLQAPLAQAARRYDGNALQTLVAIMNDDRATTAARVRCAEFILDRAHGKPAYLEDPNRDPDFVPLAERLKAYVRRGGL
jgi:hypothetical protein